MLFASSGSTEGGTRIRGPSSVWSARGRGKASPGMLPSSTLSESTGGSRFDRQYQQPPAVRLQERKRKRLQRERNRVSAARSNHSPVTTTIAAATTTTTTTTTLS